MHARTHSMKKIQKYYKYTGIINLMSKETVQVRYYRFTTSFSRILPNTTNINFYRYSTNWCGWKLVLGSKGTKVFFYLILSPLCFISIFSMKLSRV